MDTPVLYSEFTVVRLFKFNFSPAWPSLNGLITKTGEISKLAHLWADFAQALILRARSLYVNEDFGLNLDETAVMKFDKSKLHARFGPGARFRTM